MKKALKNYRVINEIDNMVMMILNISLALYVYTKNQIDYKAGTTGKGQTLFANISPSRANRPYSQY